MSQLSAVSFLFGGEMKVICCSVHLFPHQHSKDQANQGRKTIWSYGQARLPVTQQFSGQVVLRGQPADEESSSPSSLCLGKKDFRHSDGHLNIFSITPQGSCHNPRVGNKRGRALLQRGAEQAGTKVFWFSSSPAPRWGTHSSPVSIICYQLAQKFPHIFPLFLLPMDSISCSNSFSNASDFTALQSCRPRCNNDHVAERLDLAVNH